MTKEDLFCAGLLMVTGQEEAETVAKYTERIRLAQESGASPEVINLTVNTLKSLIEEELKHIDEVFDGYVRETGIEPEVPEEISDKAE